MHNYIDKYDRMYSLFEPMLYHLCVIHIKVLVLIKIQFVAVKPVTTENKYTYHILPLMTAETVTHTAQSDS